MYKQQLIFAIMPKEESTIPKEAGLEKRRNVRIWNLDFWIKFSMRVGLVSEQLAISGNIGIQSW